MVDFASQADEEILAAARWYAARGRRLGTRFVDEVEATASLLDEDPLLGSPWRLHGLPREVRRLPVRTFLYVLVYVTDDPPLVIAVTHGSRRPGYWRDRIG